MATLPEETLRLLDEWGYVAIPKDKIQVIECTTEYDSHLILISNIAFDHFNEMMCQTIARDVVYEARKFVDIKQSTGKYYGKLKVIVK